MAKQIFTFIPTLSTVFALTLGSLGSAQEMPQALQPIDSAATSLSSTSPAPQLKQLGKQAEENKPAKPGKPEVLTMIPVTKNEAAKAFKRMNELLEVKPQWSGNAKTCEPGATSKEFEDATLEAINLFRGLGRMQPVSFDPELGKKAQAAALVMNANNQLSHYPGKDWKCFSEEAYKGAGQSNLHISPDHLSGPYSILAYLLDFGESNQSAGHRRWIMFPPSLTMGYGDTGNSSAIVVHGNKKNGEQTTAAWPLPGYFPSQWVTERWSYSTDNVRAYDLSDAQVVVRDAQGKSLPLRINKTTLGFGNDTLVWELAKPVTAKGNQENTYHVTVSDMRKRNGDPIPDVNYDVTLFDPTYVHDKPESRLSGPERITTSVSISRNKFDDNSAPTVFLATANSYPDALVGGAAASLFSSPLLLTNKDKLTTEVIDELRRLGSNDIRILGGKGVISEAVAKELKSITGKYAYRIAGPDRYSTSVEISRSAFAAPKTGIIVSGNAYAEAISAANLFGYTAAPIYLVNPARKEPTKNLLAELERLEERKIIVVNGDGKVPDELVDNLRKREFDVSVIHGKDKYDANLKTAKYTYGKPIPNYSNIFKKQTVFFVTGENFPDGLAVSALINRFIGPVIFVKDNCFNKETYDFLQTLNPKDAVLIGGKRAVPDGLATFPLCK